MDISSMLEVQVDEVKEVDSKENVTPREQLPSTTNVSSPISQEETNFYKLMFGNDISVVRFRKLHCTACDAHIGSAPGDAGNMFEHPVLHTLLCAKCRDFYGDGTFEQGDDATDMFCRWCANGGNLYCCSYCSNTFCYKCIKRNIDPVLRKKIEADEQWKCFVCDPTDLFPARATCRALLESIQRMTRFLENSCRLSQQEIDDKMNLDETNCCPRRRKRKRRRTGSNSDDDDVSYTPRPVPATAPTKKKKKGRPRKVLNGSNVSTSGQSFSGTEDNSMDHSEILPSLLSCEQSMVEVENETVNTDGTVVSQPPQNSLPPRIEANFIQQPMFNAIMNAVASNLLQSTPSVVPIRHVHNPMNQVNLFQAVQCSPPTPMVTIPNQSAGMLNRFILPKVQPEAPPKTASSNVIEIESDSEDVAVVGPSRNSRSFKDHIDNNKAVPIALVSSKSYSFVVKKPELSERCTVKTLNQRLIPHGQEIDNIMTNLRTKLQSLFEISKLQETKKYGLNDARVTIKNFHREIRDTVSQLACINDRIVREYNRWRRYQLKSTTTPISESNNSQKVKEAVIPLDMTCVNESDSDTENSEFENNIIQPSEFVGTTNVVDGLKSFKKKIFTSRAVGDDCISFVNKTVQVFEGELDDYDKCIRHSSTKKSDTKSGIQEQFENYEEQFIHYLQTCIVSESVESEESKDLPDPNETPLKDLIEANSPFISEMLETMDKSVMSSDSNDIRSSNKEEDSNSEPPLHQDVNSITHHSQEKEFVQMVPSMNSDLGKKGLENASAPVSDAQEKTISHEKRFSTDNQIFVANIPTEGSKNTNTINCNTINSAGNNEDDCAIIDD
ncbi:PREDICTED: uncharacterized protein LOC107191449 [Dufourea novaeangliae]|uniref:Transcriptional regulator ATRX n=1 Tax=Dufourea novaeangliae TaxID=178035 RepID=A0A154PNF4_DUFNO|nr:PREDICTED: uncharacterized protein LOC107191449 [Dufourea novaeangliae]KZC13379.1 Transcriptional regulator ATRX [Dufourea novaeangliae]